ncbi:MAG TPA: ABC-2 family transporter protein [Ktedonobacterales bacterium]|nr:ABC-2 family transporter protein [Ktedonobacterales bacterium]
MLRFYVEVARTAFRRQLIYRWANLAGLFTNVFFGAVISYVIIALFHARPVVAGYDVRDTLRYTWLVQAMIMVVLPFGWFDLLLTIRTGEVAADLNKPCDFYWYWFSREVGRDAYYLIFRGVPTYVAGMLLFGFGMPPGFSYWLPFALSLGAGAALGIAYRFLANLVSFWLIEGRAAAGLAYVIALFCAGSYVPIAFFPSGLRAVVEWLPFSALLNAPAEIFIGTAAASAVPLLLARQALWLVALTLAARGLTTLAGRRVVVQGG